MGSWVRPAALTVGLVLAALAGSGAPVAAQADCEAWDPFTPELITEIQTRHPHQRFTAAVEDLDRHCTFHLAEGRQQSTASVIKVTIMAGALLRAQDEDRPLTAGERSLIEPMIAVSDDAAASALWVSLGGAAGMQRILDRFGLDDTVPVEPQWGASLTTAADQIELMEQLLVGGGPLDAAGRQEARGFLERVVPSQQWGARAGVPDEWPVPMKNGFFDSVAWDWRINTVGYVDPPDRDGHLLAVLTDGWATEASGIEGVELVGLAINTRLGRLRPPAHPFLDVGEGAHHEQAVVELTAAGVVNGRSPVFFDPHGPVTRAQLASMLYRLAGSPPIAGPVAFADVGSSSVHAPAIAWLVERGITTGATPATFAPGRPVTRAQAAAFLYRAAGSPPIIDQASPFVDVDPGAYYADAVTWMYEEGITFGIDADRYAPGEPLSRGQAASLLVRAGR